LKTVLGESGSESYPSQETAFDATNQVSCWVDVAQMNTNPEHPNSMVNPSSRGNFRKVDSP